MSLSCEKYLISRFQHGFFFLFRKRSWTGTSCQMVTISKTVHFCTVVISDDQQLGYEHKNFCSSMCYKRCEMPCKP